MRLLFLILLLLTTSCSKEKDYKVVNNKQKTEVKKNEDIALLVDVSGTMLSPDFEPTRLSNEIALITKIINNKKENQSFAIVLHAGNSFIICPLTNNKQNLLNTIPKIENYWRKIDPGTNPPEALLNAVNSLKHSKNDKSILLITDGSTNLHTYPLELAEKALIYNNIRLNAIYISPKDYELYPITIDNNYYPVFEKTKVKPMDETIFSLSKKTNGFQKRFYTVEEMKNFDFKKMTSAQSKKAINTSAKNNEDSTRLQKIFAKLDSINLNYQKK